jgi:anti-sigma regulatory factor (Ser/Thr protein kinase)
METVSESKTFPANLNSLDSIREFLINSGKLIGLDKNRTYKLCLAVDEIATNIINYGYPQAGISGGDINLHWISDQHHLTVTLEDSAIPFNPVQHNFDREKELSVPLEERRIGGMGIMLAKESVDEFSYEYQDGKNNTIFRMNLS